MSQPISTVERAFQLARSGDCENLAAVRRRLKSEGCTEVDAQLSGPSLVRQLRDLCVEARKLKTAEAS